MKSFEVSDCGVDEFVRRLTGALENRELGKIVSFKKEGNAMVVTISKLGTTEQRYKIDPLGAQGFRGTLANEKLALAHRPFKSEFESKIVSAMEKLGAKVTG